ncbi:MAG: hypothetical protein JSR21_05045 [Proteobacteria bacterium]|nr:hypothetical protein [Pseudomonadota bacterium]
MIQAVLHWVRAWWVAILAVAGLAVFCAAWFGPGILTRIGQPTTGAIYVSGPQVYTRERLVNDRYREDAWLLNQLNREATFGTTESIDRRRSMSLVGTASAGRDGGDKPAADAGSGDGKTGDGKTGAGAGAATQAGRIDLTPFDKFRAALTYREQIRTMIIENQLDDRHDLRGNSLYRLRFDAAVIPGDNTLASAKVTVSVLPPDGLLAGDITDLTSTQNLRREEAKLAKLDNLAQLTNGEQIQVWERIYLRWLDSLGKRFEDGRKTLRVAYDTDRFAPTDYEILIGSVRTAIMAEYRKIVEFQTILGNKPIPADLPGLSEGFVDQLIKGANQLFMPPPDVGAVIARFREDYRLGNVGPDDTVSHRAYKAEVDRLIGVVRQLAVVRAYLKFLLFQPKQPPPLLPGPPEANLGPPPAPAPPPAPPPAPRADDGCGDLKTYGTLASPPPENVDFTLSYFMDVAFEGNLAKSILGLQPEQSEVQDGLTTLNSINALIPLAQVEAHFGSNGPAFIFKRQVATLVITDRRACFPDSLKDTIRSWTIPGQAVQGATVPRHEVFVLNTDIGHIRFLIQNPEYDLQTDIGALTADWPVAAPGERAHVVTKIVQAGLINFIRAAGRRMDAFSYAFAPSEPDVIAATRSLDERNLMLAAQGGAAAAGVAGSGGVKLANELGIEISRNAVRKMVIPFGEQSSSAIATFGWVIQPQDPIDGTDAFRQRASQTALTALISLPAWWEQIHLRIARAWVAASGEQEQPVGAPQDYTIELPVNFETVDASLFETNDRSPIINEWATDEVIVRPCMRADIVIPGRRLWRSTVVMLGSQKADEIFVLPDMNGIVATFNPVLFPSTWSNLAQDYKVPLTVWTSQGSTSLPVRAKFHALAPGDPLSQARCPASASASAPPPAPSPPEGAPRTR